MGDSNSGDTTLSWVAFLLMLVSAVVAAFVWSMVDRKRIAYPGALGWLRFILRLTLSVSMLSYGLDKIFLDQMASPSLAMLNEPLGNASPMMLLWTLIGSNPVFQILLGLVETGAGLLLLFRRTALLGGICTAFVVSNVVLYDYCFDVGVKIYSTHLLLMAIVLVAPDLSALVSLFFRNKPEPLSDTWVPPTKTRWSRRAIALLEIGVCVVIFGYGSYNQYTSLISVRKHRVNIEPFWGEWHVESASRNGKDTPFLSSDRLTLTEIYVSPTGAVNARDSDGMLLDADLSYDKTAKTVRLDLGTTDHPITYTEDRPDSSHLVLRPIGVDSGSASTLTLLKVHLPSQYPLLDRGFHLVNERMFLR